MLEHSEKCLSWFPKAPQKNKLSQFDRIWKPLIQVPCSVKFEDELCICNVLQYHTNMKGCEREKMHEELWWVRACFLFSFFPLLFPSQFILLFLLLHFKIFHLVIFIMYWLKVKWVPVEHIAFIIVKLSNNWLIV